MANGDMDGGCRGATAFDAMGSGWTTEEERRKAAVLEVLRLQKYADVQSPETTAMRASERPASLLLSLADWLEPWDEERFAYRYLRAE